MAVTFDVEMSAHRMQEDDWFSVRWEELMNLRKQEVLGEPPFPWLFSMLNMRTHTHTHTWTQTHAHNAHA